MICDVCGGEVVQRPDDTPEAIERRLSLYDEQTSPVLGYYRGRGMLQTVDGNREMDEVSNDLIHLINGAASGVK
jgi:adenylate kinase